MSGKILGDPTSIFLANIDKVLQIGAESIRPVSTTSTLGEDFGLLGNILEREKITYFFHILQFIANNALLTVHMTQQARLYCCLETQDCNTQAALFINYMNYYPDFGIITKHYKLRLKVNIQAVLSQFF